jgi:integrase
MAGYRVAIPKGHRPRFRRFLEWLIQSGLQNPGPSDLTLDHLTRYAASLSGEKVGTQGAYLLGAVRGAEIIAPWLSLGTIRRRAQDLVNAGCGYKRKGRSPNQGATAKISLPIARWPAEHRSAWRKAVAEMENVCGDEDDDPFARYANPELLPAFSRNPGTRRNHAHAWGRWLWVMQSAGEDWVVTADRLELFIRSCLSGRCRHGGVAGYLSSLLFMLRIIAPATDPETLAMIRATRDSEKARHGAPASPEIAHPADLVRVGLELMRRAEAIPVSSRAAIDYRDGLLLYLGVLIPSRSVNLGGLRLNCDLFLDEKPRILWETVDIKGRIAHTYDLPGDIAARMRVMWQKYRPMLMGADAASQDYFFGPRRGGSGRNRELTPSGINRIVTRRTAELLGKRVTGYSRRHSVATMITEEAPEQVEHVQLLLQQASPKSKSFYVRQAKKVLATKLAQECLADLRKRDRDRTRF